MIEISEDALKKPPSPQWEEALRIVDEECKNPTSGTAAKLKALEKQAPDTEEERWVIIWHQFHQSTDERGLMELFELPQ